MKSCIINNNDLQFLWTVLGKGLQVSIEYLTGRSFYFANKRISVHGRKATVQIRVLKSMLIFYYRLHPSCGQAFSDMGLQSEPALVLKVQIDNFVPAIIILSDLSEPVYEVFLKEAKAASSFL